MTTLETLLALAKTDEGLLRIRVMVAELNGYEFKDEGWRYPKEEDWQKFKAVYHGDGFIGLCKPEWLKIPDYTGSLDAMHEVEETLNNDNTANYQQNLMMTWTGARTCDFTLYPADCIWHATALQRAIAFILTKQSA